MNLRLLRVDNSDEIYKINNVYGLMTGEFKISGLSANTTYTIELQLQVPNDESAYGTAFNAGLNAWLALR